MTKLYKVLFISALAVLVIPIVVFGVSQGEEKPEPKKLTEIGTGEYVQTHVKELKEAKEEDKEDIRKDAIKKYEKVKEKVGEAENITEEKKTEILAKIDAQIASMNELKTQVQAAVTVEEVKAVMIQVKTRFKYSLGLVRQEIKGVHADKLNEIVGKLTNLHEKLTVKVAAMTAGEEKTSLELLLSKGESFIVNAKAKITSGDLEDAKEDLESAKETLKEVASKLTEYGG
jgi:hypothetical protein